MSTSLDAQAAATPAVRPARSTPPSQPRWLPLRPGWPLTAFLLGFPLFWAAGLAAFAAPILAVPMAVELVRRRPIKVPRGFWLWLLFLAWTLGGLLVLGTDPPGTVPGSFTGRLFGFGMREVSYLTLTVFLLYVGNLDVRELSQRRLVRLLGGFYLIVAAFGVLATVWPNLEFTSPLELLLPGSVRDNLYVHHLVHPSLAQVQDFGGDLTPRTSAPFSYSNVWGFHLTLLMVWFVVAWWRARAGGKLFAAVAVLAGLATLVLSLNRAAWLAVVLAVGYLLLRLALRGRIVPLVGVVLALTIGSTALLAGPLGDVVTDRLDNGKSDSIRAFTTERALDLALDSPVVGYGSTRAAVGAPSSITVGKSPDCRQCGNVPIGINGYLYMLLMSTGFVGTFFFFAFGARMLRGARHDRSVIAVGASLVVLLTGYYALAYDVSTWLMVPFISLGILWRCEQERGSP